MESSRSKLKYMCYGACAIEGSRMSMWAKQL